MPNNTDKIARIRKILESGATQVSIDGNQVTVNEKSLRKELARLIATDDATATNPRPVVASIQLGSAT